MKTLGYYNGKFGPLEEMTVPMNDRACYFGDGVYEATLARNGKIFALKEHLDRFFNSAGLIKIDIPYTKDELAAILYDMLAKMDDKDIFIYWQMTRGTGIRQHQFPAAGTMGQGIAKAFAQVDGYEVALCDIKQEWAEGGKAKIAKGYDRLVQKGKLTQEAVDAILAKITPGLKEDLCADCDLIVEAAFENMEVKKTTFSELDKIAKPECIFASNTSSLSITEIGNGLTRPMIGMHFFNPADRMKLVEVIAGVNTPAETVDAIKKIAEEIGKTPVQVNEAAGFVVNRILVPMINEAAFIKMEGVSDIAGIDAAMKLGANHPMGPLELGDFIGLDICLAIMDVLYAETGDSKYRACPLLRKMVRGGNLGVKSGKGFYVYNADRTKTPVDAQ